MMWPVSAYKVTERLLVEGQELSLEANDASVWVRENGKWKCAIHTETLAGDPFGRDEKHELSPAHRQQALAKVEKLAAMH
jgi:hypothetical protein